MAFASGLGSFGLSDGFINEKGIDLEEVDYLIADSVSDKIDYQVITKSKMNIMKNTSELSDIVIYKGEIDEKVLSKRQKTFKWINEKLNNNDIKDIYLAVITEQDELYILS